MIADATADARQCAADLLAQAEHGPDSRALLLSLDPALSGSRRAARRRARERRASRTSLRSTRRSPARTTSRPSTSSSGSRTPRTPAARIRNAGSVFVRTSAVVGDYAAGATHVLPTRRPRARRRRSRSRGVPQADPVRARERRGARPSAADRAPARTHRGPAAARGRAGGAMIARPLPPDFRAYAWAPSSAEVAARHGLRPEQILRFDQNTPPVPGVPQIPLAESFARLNEYPDGTYRELREAAAAYCGVDPATDRDRRRRGRPDRDLCADVPRPGAAGSDHAADLSALPDHEPARGCRGRDARPTAQRSSGSATRTTRPASCAIRPRSRRWRLRNPAAAVVVDEAYFEYADATLRAADRRRSPT